MKTITALLLIAVTLLGYLGYASRQEQIAESAAIDAACSAERNQLTAPADSLPNNRNLACISWQDPSAPDFETPRG